MFQVKASEKRSVKVLGCGLKVVIWAGQMSWLDLVNSLFLCQAVKMLTDFFFVFVIVMGKRDVSSAACLEALQRV